MEKEKFELYSNQNTLFQVETCKDNGLMLNFIIKTNGFSGHGPIYFETEDLNNAIYKLSDMIKNLNGNLILHDIESTEYFIKFLFDKHELIIEGTIGDYDSNSLHFSFMADQTVLMLLIDVLNNLKL